MKEKTVKLIIQTEEWQQQGRSDPMLEVCTCPNDEKTIRKIIEAYETIWEYTLEKGGTSTDPIVNNWESSRAIIEKRVDPEYSIYYDYLEPQITPITPQKRVDLAYSTARKEK